MKKFWKTMRTALAILAIILYAITMQAAIMLYNIDSKLLNPRTYKTTLMGQQVYARLPRVMADQLMLSMEYDACAENPFMCENLTPEFKNCIAEKLGDARIEALSSGNQALTNTEKNLIRSCFEDYLPEAIEEVGSQGAPEFMKTLKVGDWETILIILFPEDELRLYTENLVDNLFAYLNGNQENFTITFTAIKTRLSGEAGLAAMLEIIRAQPPCKDIQVEPMINIIKSGTTPDPFCNLPEEKLLELEPDIRRMLYQTTQTIPDNRILLDAETGENSEEGGGLGGSLRNIHFLLRFSPVIALGFMLLVTILCVRTPRTWLHWWGIPSFFTGLAVIITSLSSSALFNQVWVNLLASRIPPYISISLAELLRGVVDAMIRRLTTGMIFGGLIFTILGLAMWIASYFIKSDETE